MRVAVLAATAFILMVPALASVEVRAQDVEPDSLESKAMAWVELIDAGEFQAAEGHVAPAVAAQLNAEVLAQSWPQLVAQTGELQALAPGGRSTLQGLPAVDLAGTFANGSFTVQVVFDAEDLVMGFFVKPPGG